MEYMVHYKDRAIDEASWMNAIELAKYGIMVLDLPKCSRVSLMEHFTYLTCLLQEHLGQETIQHQKIKIKVLYYLSGLVLFSIDFDDLSYENCLAQIWLGEEEVWNLYKSETLSFNIFASS